MESDHTDHVVQFLCFTFCPPALSTNLTGTQVRVPGRVSYTADAVTPHIDLAFLPASFAQITPPPTPNPSKQLKAHASAVKVKASGHSNARTLTRHTPTRRSHLRTRGVLVGVRHSHSDATVQSALDRVSRVSLPLLRLYINILIWFDCVVSSSASLCFHC
jgi:hypothetical protein